MKVAVRRIIDIRALLPARSVTPDEFQNDNLAKHLPHWFLNVKAALDVNSIAVAGQAGFSRQSNFRCVPTNVNPTTPAPWHLNSSSNPPGAEPNLRPSFFRTPT